MSTSGEFDCGCDGLREVRAAVLAMAESLGAALPMTAEVVARLRALDGEDAPQ